jgi:hypothetical protein
MNSIKQWYVRNQDAITWFIIGILSLSCLSNLYKGDYSWAAMDVVIIYVNFRLRNVRMS